MDTVSTFKIDLLVNNLKGFCEMAETSSHYYNKHVVALPIPVAARSKA